MATFFFLALGVAGCGDHCEALCSDLASALGDCRSTELTWNDLGATGRADYTRQCRKDWDATSADLGSRELELALDLCAESQDELAQLDCDQLIALYGPSD